MLCDMKMENKLSGFLKDKSNEEGEKWEENKFTHF